MLVRPKRYRLQALGLSGREALLLLDALGHGASADLDAPPGLVGELMPFQAAGVRYALRRRRAFIADEQGLGKTIQALAAIECEQAFPAVVICPASLKLNWEREIARWLPHRTTTVVSGTGTVAAGQCGEPTRVRQRS